ncbi:hypothetical protein [Kribbella sp. C-35]|uniref:hypothetical protein n=1 Tax=Kribbella sp. C-35 TaxID=2789276 RepID=UPI00397C6CE9
MAQESDLDELRRMIDRTMSGVGEPLPRRAPAAPEQPRTEPRTFEQRVAAAVQNAPEYVDAIRTARDSLGAAGRSMAEVDLLDDNLRRESYELQRMLDDRSPEGHQRLVDIVQDWNGRLERGQEQLAQVVTHLDAAKTALDTATQQRDAAETPGMLPSSSAPEHNLATMTSGVETAQQRAASLGERLQDDRTTLEHFVLDKAENPPSNWHNEIRDAAPSIRWTDNVRGELAGRIDTVSSQVDGLATKLDQYSPETDSPESAQSTAALSEQDLRLRTTGKAAARGGQQTTK